MRFLFFADLHLDAAFAWAGREGARRRRQAIRDAFTNILALAGEIRPDAILCAGDLYEDDRVTADTGAFLRSRFEEAALPIYIAPGNHDFLGPQSVYERLDWPANVTIFESPDLTAVELAPGLRLWGAAHRAPAGTPGFLDGGFRTGGGAVELALFHGSERSSFDLQGDKKSPHAEFRPEEIEQAGLHHAFVGHYHVPAEQPWHTYPGNPQPLTFGETGTRGAVEVEVDEVGLVSRQWHQVETSPAHDLELDLTGILSGDDVRRRLSALLEGKGGVARVALLGEVPSDAAIDFSQLREVANGLDAPPVLDGSAIRIAYDVDAIATENTVRGQFVRDVMASQDLDELERRRVLITGLRALDGRSDLEVPG